MSRDSRYTRGNVPAEEVGQHAERISVAVHSENRKQFIEILEKRMEDLTEPQKKRIMKVIRKIKQ